jgi:hypothetical protein
MGHSPVSSDYAAGVSEKDFDPLAHMGYSYLLETNSNRELM